MKSSISSSHRSGGVEGAAGTAVAAFMEMARDQADRVRGKNIAIVLCGANIDAEVLRGIL